MITTGLPVKKTPCNECPFRKKSIAGWLGGGLFGQSEEYLKLAHSNINLACHKSHGFKENDADRMRPCAGLAIFRNNVGKVPVNSQALEATISVRTRACTEVFESNQEFHDHHTKFRMTSKSDEDIVKAEWRDAECFLVQNTRNEHFGKYMVCRSSDSDTPLGVGDTPDLAWTDAKTVLVSIYLSMF